MNDSESEVRVSRTFALASILIATTTLAAMVLVASHEWFFGDDFMFLSHAQRPTSAADWFHVFAPLRPRLWWSYRPLTIEVYFKLAVSLFGLAPFWFLVVNIAVHALSALLVASVARQLGFGAHAAILAGVLGLAMYPTSAEIFWASTFQHVGARFFFLAGITTFLEFLRTGNHNWQVAACGFLFLSLLSNEIAITFSPVLFLLAFCSGTASPRDRVGEALWSTAPQIAMTVLFAAFRFVIFPDPVMPPSFLYISSLGTHMFANFLSFMSLLVHESRWHGAALAMVLAVCWIAVYRRGDRSCRRKLAKRTLLFLAWLAVGMLPFLGLGSAHRRVAMLLEIPVCLLVAAHFDALRLVTPLARVRWFELAALAFAAAAVPVATLRHRALHPVGQVNQVFAAALWARPDLGRFGCVVVRLDPQQEWHFNERFDVNFRMNGILSALHPNEFQQLFVGTEPSLRRDCLEMLLGRTPDGRYELHALGIRSVGPSWGNEGRPPGAP